MTRARETQIRETLAELLAVASNVPIADPTRLLSDAEVREETYWEGVAEARAFERAGGWSR